MNTNFQDIPFDFLLCWSKKHTAQYPILGYVKTLAGKASYATIGDIYAPLPKTCKKLSELRAALSAMTSELETAYANSTTTYILPSTPGLAPSDAVSEFMSEYADITDAQVKKIENYQNAREIRAKVFRLYNIPGKAFTTGLRDMDYVATTLGISRERVRQILAEVSYACRRIFLGETVDQIQAETTLVDWFTQLDSKLATAMPLSTFRTITGVDGSNPYSERFLMDILGLSVSTNKSHEPYVSKGRNLGFAYDMGKVVRFFREKAIPVPMTDFDVFLKKTFKDAGLLQNVRDYVLHCDDYEILTGSDGLQTIALKWDNLLFIPSEIARILYDRNAFEVQDAISKDELIREYNRRAGLLKKDAISAETAGISRHALVLALGKSGFYKIRKYKEVFKDGLEFARDYVRTKLAESSLQEFIALCETEGYIHVYGERTMTSYYYTALQPLSGKGASEKHPGLSAETILRTAAEELEKSGGPVQVSALGRLVSERIGDIPDPSFRMYLRRAAGILFDLTPTGRKCLMVSLRPSDIESFDFSQFSPRTREAAYRAAVEATAVDELRRIDGHKMQLKELVKKLKALLPSGIAPNNIYKMFSDNDIFVKTSAGKKRGDVYVELNPAKYQDLYQKTATQAAPEIAATVPAHIGAELYESSFSWPSLRTILCGQFRQIASGHGMNIRDIINEMYDIMRGRGKEVEEGTEEYKILSLLNNYYTSKTSPYDRELLAIKLVMGLEPYLRSLYKKVKGEDISGVNGLGTLIQKLQEEYYLPTDEDGTDIGRGLNNMIGAIITRRNKIHTNFEGFSGCAEVNSTMGMFLKFYILTAAYSLYYVE